MGLLIHMSGPMIAKVYVSVKVEWAHSKMLRYTMVVINYLGTGLILAKLPFLLMAIVLLHGRITVSISPKTA